MTASRVWAASGLLAVLLLGSTALIAPPPPGAGAAPAQITAYYAAYRDGLGLEALLYWVGAILLLVFAARLLQRLGIYPLTLLGFGAAVTGVGLMLAEDVTFQALFYDRGEPGQEVSLSDLQNLFVSFSFLPYAVFLASMGWALRSSGSPRLGVCGLVAAALQLPSLYTVLAAPGPLAAGGVLNVIAFAGLLGWLLLTSISLVVSPSAGSEAARPGI